MHWPCVAGFSCLWAHNLRTGDKHPAYTPHGTLYLQSFTLLANNHSLPTCTTHCHTTDCTWRADRSKCIGVSEKSSLVQKIQQNDIIYNNNDKNQYTKIQTNSIQIRKSRQLKYSRTKLPWFSCLLQHSARKRGGLTLQRPRAHTRLLFPHKSS